MGPDRTGTEVLRGSVQVRAIIALGPDPEDLGSSSSASEATSGTRDGKDVS